MCVKSKSKESSLDVLRLQWDLGSELIKVIEPYPLNAIQKVAVLEVIVADLKTKVSFCKE